MIRKYIKYILPALAVVAFTFAVVHVARTQQTPPKATPPVPGFRWNGPADDW